MKTQGWWVWTFLVDWKRLVKILSEIKLPLISDWMRRWHSPKFEEIASGLNKISKTIPRRSISSKKVNEIIFLISVLQTMDTWLNPNSLFEVNKLLVSKKYNKILAVFYFYSTWKFWKKTTSFFKGYIIDLDSNEVIYQIWLMHVVNFF